MKQIKVIARQRIINPHTMTVHDDDGLRALNRYYEDVIAVEEPFDETSLVLQFEEAHPELKGWNFQLVEIDK